MTDFILERDWDPPVTLAEMYAAWVQGAGCFGLYRVAWHRSLLSLDGRKLVCHFSAPDAESMRIALRIIGADMRRLWPGTVHDVQRADASPLSVANVLVRRRFAEPVGMEEIQAREDAGAACLEMRDVEFVRSYFSADRRRMLCMYRAPDAESVREAQHLAGMPVEDVWGFTALSPEQLARDA